MYQHCLKLARSITKAYGDRWWAARGAVCKGTPPPPPAPDYAKANREAIIADIESLPARKTIEAAARMGGSGSVSVGDRTVAYDFEGISDLDQQVTKLEGQRRSADSMAQTALDIQQKYGTAFMDESLKRIEESDPVGFKVRKRLAEITLSELESGASLSADEIRFAEQAFRRSSASRGGAMLGTAPAMDEAFAQYGMGRRLLGERLNMARSYVGMPQTGQLGQVAGAQAGAAPFMPQQLAGLGLNANAGAMGTQFASSTYSTQGSIYGAQLANRSDPMGTILGGVATIGLTAATGGLGGILAGTGAAGAGASALLLGGNK